MFEWYSGPVTTNGRSPTARSPSSNEDIEMADAPSVDALQGVSTPNERVASSFPSSGASSKTLQAEQWSSARSNDDAASSAVTPSGGWNGLNQLSNCGLCGSSLHPTFACDNVEARSMSAMKCFRCGSFDHRKDACATERCLECGSFGHSMRVCTKPCSLPKSEKERIRKLELSHKLFMQRSQEMQRKKQLGEHAKEAPVIQATSRSPSPKHDKTGLKHPQQIPQKRRRESSPPFDAPKGPKASETKHQKIRVGQCSYISLNRSCMLILSRHSPLDLVKMRTSSLELAFGSNHFLYDLLPIPILLAILRPTQHRMAFPIRSKFPNHTRLNHCGIQNPA